MQSGVPIPVISLGQRAIPAWCARARVEGEAALLADPDWPGTEACSRCRWWVADEGTAIVCAAPEVALEGQGLALEVDGFRGDGRKRRAFIAPQEQVGEALLAAIRRPGDQPLEAVDLKFVHGEPERLTQESDAFMERWRFYWNGEHWCRKPVGAALHDWNKWGRNLEFVSVSEPGGMPPAGGWPPVLDLPTGGYLARVVVVRWADGRRGEPELEWVLRILEGQQRDRLVFKRSPIRSEEMGSLVRKDMALVLHLSWQRVPSPSQKGDFEALIKAARGVALRIKVARRGLFTNLYLERRLADR